MFKSQPIMCGLAFVKQYFVQWIFLQSGSNDFKTVTLRVVIIAFGKEIIVVMQPYIFVADYVPE